MYSRKSITTFMIAAAIIITVNYIPVAKSDLVFAASPWKSGYDHGVSDANTSDTKHWYILQPGKGFQFHTSQFNAGYVDGFCNIKPHASSDADQAIWNCDRGISSIAWINK